MSSITNNVKIRHDSNDIPIPAFTCPVGISGNVLKILKKSRVSATQLTSEAANAVDLVGRFERSNVDYVDFSTSIPLASLLRVTLVSGKFGLVAVIDFPDTMKVW